MKEKLKTELLEYLGGLLYTLEHTYDWIKRSELTRKINAVYELLDMPQNEVSELQKLINAITGK